jgi:hypothetical protein
MKLAAALLLAACCSSLFAQQRRYEVQVEPNSSSLGSRDIQMRDRYNPDPSQRFRGEIEQDGSVRMRNLNGERLRGEIDRDGYGRLRDQDGNVYRIRPQ